MFGRIIGGALHKTGGSSYYDPLRARIGEAALLAQKAARPAFRHLWDAEVKVYSQWGEDGILDYLCDCLDIIRPRSLELGVGNFLECNTRFLAEHRAGSVVAVDARTDLSTTMRALPEYWRTSIWAFEEWITPESVSGMLSRARVLMGGVDVLSLDIDGNDYWVAEALDFSGVQIIVVEYNPLLGHRLPVSVPRDDGFDRRRAHPSWLYYGASLRAWIHLFHGNGFTFVGTNRQGNNAFFCPSARLAEIPLATPELEDLTRFVDWRVRESRGDDGRLSYLSGADRTEAIGSMPLIDVATERRLSVAEAN